MENPPPNYNPTESLLNGGQDVPIMKVMGGGGDAPPGYNETASLLTGGIDEPIVAVSGGARPISPQQRQYRAAAIAKQQKLIKNKRIQEKYQRGKNENVGDLGSIFTNQGTDDSFVTQGQITSYVRYDNVPDLPYPQSISSTSSAINKLESDLKIKSKTDLAYIKSGSSSSYNATVPRGTNYAYVKYIPTTVNLIIVLPPVNNDQDFLKHLKYLGDNNFFTINKKGEFIIKNKVFIIHLIDTANLTNNIYYMYLKLKITNVNKYFVADYPHKIIYPEEVNGKRLLFTNDTIKQATSMYLDPSDFVTINANSITQMAYEEGADYPAGSFFKIHGGTHDTPLDTPNLSGISINNNILLIDLKKKGFPTIKADVNGIQYSIRVPNANNENDRLYSLWLAGNYSNDEQQLIDDLDITNVSYINNPEKIAEILFQLAYFKCFNDVSLLTKKECFSLRHTLQILYKNKLEKEEGIAYGTGIPVSLDTPYIKKYKCYSIDIGKKIMCKVTYMLNNEIFKKDIGIDYMANKDAIHKNDKTSADQIKAALSQQLMPHAATI